MDYSPPWVYNTTQYSAAHKLSQEAGGDTCAYNLTMSSRMVLTKRDYVALLVGDILDEGTFFIFVEYL